MMLNISEVRDGLAVNDLLQQVAREREARFAVLSAGRSLASIRHALIHLVSGHYSVTGNASYNEAMTKLLQDDLPGQPLHDVLNNLVNYLANEF